MDATSQSLKYQTWLLKVSIHCEGCRRKVKKVLQSIDGVFTTTIDPQQHKVTVTGSVGVETLIRKLAKAGKHAEVLPENVTGKGNDSSSNKAKKKKKSEQKDLESVQNHSSSNKESTQSSKDRGNENGEKCNGESKNSNSKTGFGSPGKSPAGGQAPEKDHKGGQGESGSGKSGGGNSGSGKKKKIKKAQNGETGSNGLSSVAISAPAHTGSQMQCPPGQVVGQVNLSPTRQQSYMYYPPETTCYPPLVQFAAYSRLCPMGTMGGPSYYVSPLPYMCADPYQLQSPPFVSFEIFSDENANGCSVM